MNRQLIAVKHDQNENIFYVENEFQRTNITSSRNALNGYQKGHCFYCFDEIKITPLAPQLADVDHFFPHILKGELRHTNLDGVWNLVLACPDCNRGIGGKFAKIPSLALLKRLHKRNEYLIFSHHPLRETLIQQTGHNEATRQQFLQQCFNVSKARLIHTWQPQAKREALF
ncbi:HNH endonuclease domain-containing protein [Vitreoscilla sp. C1]|uniref:HNH endonuclease domain-containing protein n=1 Tax=Vitreoscilla sp. (strain C1) TaxID=96942 RepID=UPI001C103121|nr:HNH endonuclease domain-containing protein [Vitreoscilla sp. C1]